MMQMPQQYGWREVRVSMKDTQKHMLTLQTYDCILSGAKLNEIKVSVQHLRASENRNSVFL